MVKINKIRLLIILPLVSLLMNCEAFRPTAISRTTSKASEYEVSVSRFELDANSNDRYCSKIEIFSDCSLCNIKAHEPEAVSLIYGYERLQSDVINNSNFDSTINDQSLKTSKYSICFVKPGKINKFNYNLDVEAVLYIDVKDRTDTIHLKKKYELRIIE